MTKINIHNNIFYIDRSQVSGFLSLCECI